MLSLIGKEYVDNDQNNRVRLLRFHLPLYAAAELRFIHLLFSDIRNFPDLAVGLF